MVEIERNPLAVRQGAATIVCIAAAAVAMPVIAHRAAEQREGADWAARSTAFQAELEQQVMAGAAGPNARIELVAFRTGSDGLRARGQGTLFEGDTHSMLVQAALRGPLAPTTNESAPSRRETDINVRELNCLSQAIYYEARGETQRGQQAVAEVIMNRTRSRAYPNTVCGVVYQGSHRVTGCQFTFTCDGSLNRRPRGRAWETAQHIAELVLKGYTRPLTGRATHYHTHAVNPVWSAGLVPTTSIGDHQFYRFPTGAERPIYQAALERRRGSRRSVTNDFETPEDAVVEDVIEATDAAVEAPVEAAPEATPAADAPIETATEVST
ncbi:cell wall hydrolyses [alpha proteobacterium U9-1i]|nr:cell wall hydrolyses [alpha proteobacterium U9-1i]